MLNLLIVESGCQFHLWLQGVVVEQKTYQSLTNMIVWLVQVKTTV